MKKVKLKINTGLKALMLAATIWGGSMVAKANAAEAVTAAFTIGLVANIKKKGITLDEGEEKLLTEVETELNAALKGVKNETEIAALIDAAKTNVLDNIKSVKIGDATLEEVLRKQGEDIASALKMGTEPLASKTIAQILKEAKEADKDGFHNATKVQGSPWFSIETKAPGDITRGNLPTAPSTFVPSQELRPGYTPYRTNEPIMLRVANVLRTTKGVINWVDETAGEGDAGWTAEGAAKPLLDVNVTVRNTTVKKVAVFSKVSEEALDDIEFLASLIETRQQNKIALKVDDGLINGDGTGETPTGLAFYAPGFTSTEMNGTIEAPNKFDALGAAATQIRRANFQPNLVFINPVDWFTMMHTKDAEERYVLLSLQMADGRFLEMVAVQSNQVDVGEFIMGDFRYFNVAIREGMRTEMGLDGNDFRNNMVSMRSEMRLAAWVSTNERLAFVMDTYQDVIDAIAVA
jgi:HK97 family phage major capsid protein